MYITWHGEGALKIQEDEVTVAVNPHDGSNGKMPSFTAQLALIGHAGANAATLRENPYVIKGPGEYEVKGVFVYGIPAGPDLTLFMIEISGVKIGYLGGFNAEQLTQAQMEQLEGVDVLCVPVGGKDVLNAKQAIRVINQIEPRLVIPIEYADAASKSDRDGVDLFLKEYGVVAKHDEVEKLKVTKKDLPQEDTRVVVIKQS